MRLLRAAVVVCASGVGLSASPSCAGKTVMWLGNFFQPNANLNGPVGRVDSVWVQGTDAGGNYTGDGGANLKFTEIPTTRAYVDRDSTKNDSILWWAMSNWDPTDFREGRVKVTISYERSNNGLFQADQMQTQEMEGIYSNWKNLISDCFNQGHGDTVWMYWSLGPGGRATDPRADMQKPSCADHDPYMATTTVHVLNPWPGAPAYVFYGGQYHATYAEANRPGWYSATLSAIPAASIPFQIKLSNGDPNLVGASKVQYMDAGGLNEAASGVALDYSTTPGFGKSIWIVPPTAPGAPSFQTKEPGQTVTLYVQSPAWPASGLRLVWQGNSAKFIPGSTKWCRWYKFQFYAGAVPSKVVLSTPLGDSIYGSNGKEAGNFANFQNWIDLSKLTNGTYSMNTDNKPLIQAGEPSGPGATVCDTKILAFSAYDYFDPGDADLNFALFYYPFSERGIDNNPSGNGANTKGLVLQNLGANGLPIWSGKTISGVGNPKNPADQTVGPQYWFDSLFLDKGKVTNVNSTTATPLNSFTCVPLTLKLDATDGYYKYGPADYTKATGTNYGMDFFPLDTFVIAGGTINRFNQKQAVGHNFHFAMHAKANFEYVSGLKFSFTGDDDVWIFINKKLALDLGGQHGPITGEINLDKLGLVEGNTYQFDMFYTERQKWGSSINIKTTMNFVPAIDMGFDTLVVNKFQIINSWVTETASNPSVCPEQGGSNLTVKRGGNPVYTLIQPDGVQYPIDSVWISKLYGKDSSAMWISNNGSHFQIDTTKVQASGKFNLSGRYQIVVSQGNIQRSVSFSIFTSTVTVAGVLLDRNGDGHPDSVTLHVIGSTGAFAPAVSALLRWADRSGTPDSVTILAGAMHRLPGDSVMTAVFPPLPLRTNCPPAGCVGDMGAVTTSTGGGAPLSNKLVRLQDGIAPVADSAWVTYDSNPSGTDTLTVWTSENLMVSPAVAPVGLDGYVLLGQKGTARALKVLPGIDGSALRFVFKSSENPIQPGDWLRLGGAISDGLGNAPGDSSVWVPLRSEPVATSWMLDPNGDGYPDSVSIRSRGDLAGAVSAIVHWKNAAGIDTLVDLLLTKSVGTGLRLPNGILKDATHCEGCLLDIKFGGPTRTFPLADSVPPVAVKASLVFGFEAVDPDTLVVDASEILSTAAAGTYVFLAADSAGAQVSALGSVNAKHTLAGDQIRLIVPAGTIGNNLSWVRLGTGISDGHKAVGESSRWVPLALKPSGRAYLFDSNGDGRADSLFVEMRGSLHAAAVVVHWPTNSATPDSRTWPMSATQGSFSVHPATSSLWFDRGSTSCVGCSVDFLDAQGNALVSWSLVDKVAPMVVSGTYNFGDSVDTLRATFSEPLSVLSQAKPWLEWGNQILGGTISQRSVDPHGSDATFLVPSITGAVDGWDSLRLAAGPASGAVSDQGGQTVGLVSPWAAIRYGLPPFTATLTDPVGAGRGTAVRVQLRRPVPKAAVDGISSVLFQWTDSARAGLESRTVSVADLAWDGTSSWSGSLDRPFALGQTACVGGCDATAMSIDGFRRTEPLLDGVPPSAIRAEFRYSVPEVGKDTLILGLSENWPGAPDADFVTPFTTIGSHAHPLDVTGMLDWTLVDGHTLRMVVPASLERSLDNGDSARLTYLASGSRIWDAAGNRVGVESRWVPIEFGLRPPRLQVYPYRPVLINPDDRSWSAPPATVPQLELLVMNTKDSSFSKLEASGGKAVGDAPVNDPDHTLGVDIRINRPLEGVLIIYDNIGTAVLSLDFSPLKSLWQDQPDAEKTIRVAWNGTGADHKFVASGVYLFRAVVKFKDREGNSAFRNVVWKLGFHRGSK